MVMTFDSHPYVVTSPQAECEVRMDHVAGPLHILLVEKEGRIWFNIKYLKFYQFKRITWWCLSVLEFDMLEKYYSKSWSQGICVRQNFPETMKPYPKSAI